MPPSGQSADAGEDAVGAIANRRRTPVPSDRLLRGRSGPRRAIPGGPMTENRMSPEQEYEFYAQPDNQQPAGPARRRRRTLSDPVPVRLPADVLEQARRAAEEDDRSLSSWIRRAVEHELRDSA